MFKFSRYYVFRTNIVADLMRANFTLSFTSTSFSPPFSHPLFFYHIFLYHIRLLLYALVLLLIILAFLSVFTFLIFHYVCFSLILRLLSRSGHDEYVNLSVVCSFLQSVLLTLLVIRHVLPCTIVEN